MSNQQVGSLTEFIELVRTRIKTQDWRGLKELASGLADYPLTPEGDADFLLRSTLLNTVLSGMLEKHTANELEEALDRAIKEETSHMKKHDAQRLADLEKLMKAGSS